MNQLAGSLSWCAKRMCHEVTPRLCSADFTHHIKLLFGEHLGPRYSSCPILAAKAGLSVGLGHGQAFRKGWEAGLPRVCVHEGPGACWERAHPWVRQRVQLYKLVLEGRGKAASKLWVSDPGHKQNVPASENVPQVNTKLPPPHFFIHLCVRFVFHVKYIFLKSYFCKLFVGFTCGACLPTISPFWKQIYPVWQALVIQRETQTWLGFKGHLVCGPLRLHARPMAPPNLSSSSDAAAHFKGLLVRGFTPAQGSKNLTRSKYDPCSFCFLNKLWVNYIIKYSWL